MNHPSSQDSERKLSLVQLLKWRAMVSVAYDIAFAILTYCLICIKSQMSFNGAFILTMGNNFEHNMLNQSHEMEWLQRSNPNFSNPNMLFTTTTNSHKKCQQHSTIFHKCF